MPPDETERLENHIAAGEPRDEVQVLKNQWEFIVDVLLGALRKSKTEVWAGV